MNLVKAPHMQFSPTCLESVFIIHFDSYVDERGQFSRIFCRDQSAPNGADMSVTQINRSDNFAAGTFRGLHFQTPPACEDKRVTCIRGKVLDIIVDLRKGSPTFLKWIGIELSEENRKMVHIPKGCAHGFQTLEPNTELLYFHSESYTPECYRGIRYNDPLVNVQLPLQVSTISKKDANFPLLDSTFVGVSP